MKRYLRLASLVSAIAVILVGGIILASPPDYPVCEEGCSIYSPCYEQCWSDGGRDATLITCGEYGVCHDPDPCVDYYASAMGTSGWFYDHLCEYYNMPPNLGWRQIAWTDAKNKYDVVYGWDESCDNSSYPDHCTYYKVAEDMWVWNCTVYARPPK